VTPKSLSRSFSALALLGMFAAVAFAQTLALARQPRVDKTYGMRPLQFEENRGQTDSSVKFLSRGPGYTIFLQPTVATFAVHRTTNALKGISANTRSEVIRMSLKDANANATMSAEQPMKGYVNYMTGPDHAQWKLGVPTFGLTRASSVYKGIDLVYYGNQRQMEYDFIVAPNADPSLIHLSITGAAPAVAANGELVLHAPGTQDNRDMRFQKPVVYQRMGEKRLPVEAAFTVSATNDVAFKLGPYDHNRELVIDPIISYASYFGGAGEEEINASALNSSNQLYVVGQSIGTALPGTAGEFETGPAANNNGHDAFVTKFSADGSSILWTTYLSGAGDDFGTGIAVNSSDQAYVVGYTASCGDGGLTFNTAGEFPFTSDGVQNFCNPDVRGFNNYESNGSGYDAFLVKLSADGKNELYGTPLGGTSMDIAQGVALDAAGQVYVVGETESTGYLLSSDLSRFADIPSYPINNHNEAAIGTANFPTTSTAFYTNTSESKLNSTYYTQSAPGIPAGSTAGPQDEQAFLTVLSADLHSFVYSSLIGGGVIGGCGNGSCNTNGLAIGVSTSGIVYIGGNTSSAHWPTTTGAFATTCSNAGTATSQCPMTGWLAAFNPSKSGNASLLFSTYMNGSSAGTDSNGKQLYPASDVFGLATDSTGNVIVTGDTNAANFPTTAGTLQPSCFEFNDGNGDTNVCEFGGFLAKLSASGGTVWSTYFGATSQDIATTAGHGVAVDANNNVYFLASTSSANLPTKNPFSSAPGSGPDAYLAELSSTASTLLMGTYLGAGGGIALDGSLHLDSNLNAYFSGSQGANPYGGTSLPVSVNAYQKTLQGNADGFVVKMITQQQPSATALTVSPNPATPAQTITLTARVTTPSTLTGTILPTGTVTFYNGTTVLGTGTLNASGVASYTGTLAAATYSITASYPGDAGFDGSVSTPTSLAVSSAVSTTTTVTVTPATSTYGTAEVLTATVKAGTTAATSGMVTFGSGTVSFGSASVNGQGIATLTVTPPVGIYSVVGSYAGTYNQTSNPNGFGPSASTGSALSITKATILPVLTSSTATAGAGVNFTLTASLPSSATGTVLFYNGTTSLGKGTVSNGIASLTTSFATANTYSLTAVYSGDSNFKSATSAILSQVVVVPGFSVTASPSSLTIARGHTGTTTLTLTPVGGYAGSMTLSCGTLPSKATCTFNSTTVTLAGAPVTDVLTIGTGSVTSALSTPQLFGDPHKNTSFAFLLGMPLSLLTLFGAARGRKRSRKMLRVSLFLMIGLAGIAGLTGCGSSSTNTNATPAGTYSLTVTVAPAMGAAAQTVPVTVTVQ
jgi:hypothetical protein